MEETHTYRCEGTCSFSWCTINLFLTRFNELIKLIPLSKWLACNMRSIRTLMNVNRWSTRRDEYKGDAAATDLPNNFNDDLHTASSRSHVQSNHWIFYWLVKNTRRYFCSQRTYVKLLNESQTRKLHMDWPCDVILLENERISWRSIWYFLLDNDVAAITEFMAKLIRSISVSDQQINWQVVFLFNPIWLKIRSIFHCWLLMYCYYLL